MQNEPTHNVIIIAIFIS